MQKQQMPDMGFPASNPPYHAQIYMHDLLPTHIQIYALMLVYGIQIYSFVFNLTFIPFSWES